MVKLVNPKLYHVCMGRVESEVVKAKQFENSKLIFIFNGKCQ